MWPFISKKIRVGDFFEDCGYHPVLCTASIGDDVEGISLINGSLRSCSVRHCGPMKLRPKMARKLALYGPSQQIKDETQAKWLVWTKNMSEKEKNEHRKSWFWWER